MRKILALKPEIFGLDISDSSLKIIKLKIKRKGFKLASFGEQIIKPGIIEKGEIIKEDNLVEVIKEGISKIKGERLKTKYVICSLPEEQGFLRVIQMPKIKREELKKAVRYEAENHIPLALDEVYLDSEIISPIHNHLDHLDVLLVAFPQGIVDSYVSCFKKAGLQPIALESESSAIARALIKKEVSPYPVLLVDLGMLKTTFIVFSGYTLRFTSSIPIFSQEFTQAVAKNLNVSLAEAEKLKLKYGLKKKGVEGKKVFEALTPILTDFLEQIKKRLDFYETHTIHEHLLPGESGIKKIFLCGGGANLEGLTEFFNGQLKITTELGNPWMNILPESRKKEFLLSNEQGLKYAAALGLALRGAKAYENKS